jgi:hypothetical protein
MIFFFESVYFGQQVHKTMFICLQSRSLAEPLATSCGTPVEKPCTNVSHIPQDYHFRISAVRTWNLTDGVGMLETDRQLSAVNFRMAALLIMQLRCGSNAFGNWIHAKWHLHLVRCCTITLLLFEDWWSQTCPHPWMNVIQLKFRFVFWDVLPCKIIVDRRFRGACCLHHRGPKEQWLSTFYKSTNAKSSESSGMYCSVK